VTDLAPDAAAGEPASLPVESTAMPAWVRRAIIFWWSILVGLWLLLIVARELRGLLIQVAVAIFLSFALEPAVSALEGRGMKRGRATLVSLVAVFIAFGVFVALMGQLLATQLTDLVDELPGYLRSGADWANDRFGTEIDTSDLINQIETGQITTFANDASRYLLSIGTALAGVLFQALTILLFTYYLTADGPRLRRLICSLLPPTRQHEVLRFLDLATDKTGAYISSRLVLAVLSGVFHWVVFALLGLPSAVALALWVGVISQFIPTLGTYLAGILPALVAVGDDPSKALWVVVAVIAYQQLENYVLQPRITAQTLDLHPAISFGAILAGTTLFGAAGALMALPVVATASGFLAAYIERHDVVAETTRPTRGRSRGVPGLKRS
jgi:predicted PurR-regulated permease PerM